MKPAKKVLFLLIISVASFIFLPWIRHAFGDANYPPLDQTVRWIYLAVFAVSFLLFGSLLFLERRSGAAAVSFRKKLLLAALIGALLVTVAPVFSIDFHCYTMQGRVMSMHHQNPYVAAPDAFSGDPFAAGIFWTHRVAFYGPFWILISVIMTFFAQNSVFLNLILLKLPLYLGYLLLVHQGYSICAKIAPEKKHIVASFLAFNPFILLQYLVDGHNDILMAALAVWAVNLVYERRYIPGYAVFTLSVLVKYMTAMLAPFLLLMAFDRLDRKTRIYGNVLVFAAVFITVTVLAYMPFMGSGPGFFRDLASHKLFFGTGGVDSNTLPYAVLFVSQKIGFLKGMNIFHPPGYVTGVFHLLFLVCGVSIFMWALAAKDRTAGFFSAVSLVFIAYFALEGFSMGAWFLVWLLPFLVLSGIRRNLTLAFLLSVAGALSFWKRLSFLLTACVFIYLLILILPRRQRPVTA